jgi:Sulfotransferase family
MATIICRKTRTAYFPVPKNGSTSLRHLFFKIENGFDFVPFKINGKPQDLFWLYRHNRPFARIGVPEGYAKMTVVRDPFARFISNYRWLAADWKAHFQETPSVDGFVARFEEFVKHSPKARFHLATQSVHLGGDLSYFDKVFRMENLPEVADYLAERGGVEMQLPWTNQSADLDDTASGASMDKIIRIYRRDYDLLGSFYSV